MRTAETILREAIGNVRYDLAGSVTNAQLISAINTARKECLEEAISKSKTYQGYEAVDEQEIQKLIDNLK